jgi:hypothetical protein
MRLTYLAQHNAAVAAHDGEAEALLVRIVDDGDFSVRDVNVFCVYGAGLSGA